MAGIKDVAKKAAVSITTASRVLNHVDYPVAAATRQRVVAAARELHYSPSALARALVTHRSGIVGVLVGDMVDPYFAEIARGVEDAARRAGYLVIVCNTDRDPAVERRYVETLADYRVDALIFVGGDILTQSERRKLKQVLAMAIKRGMLLVACAGEHAGLPAIDIDHRAAAYDMTEHLLGLGHQRIGFIGGPVDVSTAVQRESGFRSAMSAAGLRPTLGARSDFTYNGGFDAARRLLAKEPPTAIFAANDQMALGALEAALTAGVHVPDDLTVVGFGDTRAAQHARPSLTAVGMPRHEMGLAAMEAILGALGSHTTRVEPRQFPYQILVRKSSAPPRAAGPKGELVA
ncbi:MAG TPA: LacI family DNA-binding transcriptional regulator [Ktedonobacterales bacterium]|nr:LacI family DNA-binding transcriptional regulator [Ktedonobacterales bacterium]